MKAHKAILPAANSTRKIELREVGQQVSDDLAGLLTKAAALDILDCQMPISMLLEAITCTYPSFLYIVLLHENFNIQKLWHSGITKYCTLGPEREAIRL